MTYTQHADNLVYIHTMHNQLHNHLYSIVNNGFGKKAVLNNFTEL